MLSSFAGNLHGPVEVGQIFVVSGKTIESAVMLNINLTSAKEGEADIPFHFSVRFHEDSIVRNSLVDLAWGEEEREENLVASANPIMSGWVFKVYIMCSDDKFHVSINDHPFCIYNYRLPLEEIHAIQVQGDLQRIYQVDHRSAFPSLWPAIQVDQKDELKFSNDVPRRFAPGHIIVIHAIPSGDPRGSFTIKMTDDSGRRQMFHFSARFRKSESIVNSQTETLQWRKDEERCAFLFQMNQMFKMVIGISETSFDLAVNGDAILSYSYRYDIAFLDTLMGPQIEIENGLMLDVVGIDHQNVGLEDECGFQSYSL